MIILNPQPTIENPFVVEDYPYGFTLRTQMRVYVEIRNGFGMRYVTQTLNPKTGKWNKPKAGTYSRIIIVYQDPADGHIHQKAFSAWSDEEFYEFVEFCGDILNQSPYVERINAYKNYMKYRKAAGPVNVKVTTTTFDPNDGGMATVAVDNYTLVDGKIVEKENN